MSLELQRRWEGEPVKIEDPDVAELERDAHVIEAIAAVLRASKK